IRSQWLSDALQNDNIRKFGIRPNLYFLADFVEVVVKAGRSQDEITQKEVVEWSGRERLKLGKQEAGYLVGLPRNLRRAASRLRQMEEISRTVSRTTDPLPTDRTELVKYGQIS